MTIGVLSAMNEEIHTLLRELKPLAPAKGTVRRRGQPASTDGVERGRRRYHHGTLFGEPAVLVYSRCGKVAAATTATHLILEHGVEEIIFTGVAGAADPRLKIGDVVVAERLYQHDMDARPLFAQHEIPLLGVTAIETTPARRAELAAAARTFLAEGFAAAVPPAVQREFHLAAPRVFEADIASGDKFFARRTDKQELKRRLANVVAVEMEGAAVAQVCYEYGVPFSVIRTISDTADEQAPGDFTRFIDFVASAYARGILHALFAARRAAKADARQSARTPRSARSRARPAGSTTRRSHR
ncbi:MAG: 5'-methylthioadenosine/adenosylhomocysteine nucleosidase [Planctomycetota bacterium]